MPLSVYATNISNETISGPTEVTEGEEITLSYKVDFAELDKDSPDTKGIMVVAFLINYDADVLIPTELSKEFDSHIVKGKDYYVVSSTVKDGMENICQDGVTYCGNYKIDIKFYVKDTDAKKLNVSMGEVLVGVYDSKLINEGNIDEEKVELLAKNSNASHTIKIKNSSGNTNPEPASIATESKITDLKETVKSATKSLSIKEDDKKSNNNHIKSLTITGYDLAFERDKNLYTLEIPQGTNALDVSIELENDKATYEIEGAEDLSSNNNQIKIIVTAENGDKRAYIVTITNPKEKTTPKEEMIEILGYEIEKRYLKYAIILVVVIVGLLILKGLTLLLADKVGNRKINKALKDLDKDK